LVVVGFGEVAVDGGLEIDDALEDAAFQPLPGQFGEKAFDSIEPGGRGRGEVEMEPWVPSEPGAWRPARTDPPALALTGASLFAAS
jgi:hypothetical protein